MKARTAGGKLAGDCADVERHGSAPPPPPPCNMAGWSRCEARSPAVTPWSIILRCGGSTAALIPVIARAQRRSSMISLSACVAAMVWRAAHHGLNDTCASAGLSPSPLVSAAPSGVTP